MKRMLNFIFREQPIWMLVLIAFSFFSFLRPAFSSLNNILLILKSVSVTSLLGIGVTFLMLTGNFDLSVGSTMALSAALAIRLQPYGLWFAVTVALLSGLLVGALNGFLVARAKINSFVVTLSTMTALRGLVYILTGARSISGTIAGFRQFGSGGLGPIPYVTILFALVFAFAIAVSRHSVFGRNTYAIGGNIEAARAAGIPVEKTMIINFILCGFAAALAGVMHASRMNAALPSLAQNYALLVITGVVLGGNKLTGGSGSMVRTFGGMLTVEIMQRGMDIIGLRSRYNTLIMGFILILFILIDEYAQALPVRVLRIDKKVE